MENELVSELRSVLLPFGDPEAVDENGYIKRKLLLRYFHICKWNSNLILALAEGKIDNTFREDFTQIIYETLSTPFSMYEWATPSYMPYMINLTSDVILSMLIQWLKRDDMDYDEFVFLYEEVFKSNYFLTQETIKLKQ